MHGDSKIAAMMIDAAAAQGVRQHDSAAEVSSLERAGAHIFLLILVVFIFFLQLFNVQIAKTKRRNRATRRKLFARLGLETTAAPSESVQQEGHTGRKEGTDAVDASAQPRQRKVIAFFHPYCNAGGGGERVLWQAVEHHLTLDKDAVIVIFSGDVDESNSLENDPQMGLQQVDTSSTLKDGAPSATKGEILSKCFERFAIPLDKQEYTSRIQFLPLTNRRLVSDKYWKRLTLLGQSYGAMRLAFECCSQLLPNVWIDTMGYGFAYPVVKAFDRRIRIGAYVHYPMISTDMLQRVRQRRAGHTNDDAVSASFWRSRVKLLYYQLFAKAYGFALGRADVLVANGTWTQNHVNNLLGAGFLAKKRAEVVYPPCDTASMVRFDLESRAPYSVISLAQFRPEKEHSTQIHIMHKIIKDRKAAGKPWEDVTLTCAGSCRNKGDEIRIEGLKALAQELGIQDNVHFVVNAPYQAILEHLRRASIGLSTMVDEHFGINVVEFMASGLITLSHASAGPFLDIAVPVNGEATGFHAKTVPEFASEMERIFALGESEALAMRQRARQRAVDVFSNEAFCKSWDQHLWRPLLAETGAKAEAKKTR